ncbi:MAG TPA: ACP S-malonyltransferase [Spirochaetota bacterium]|nr:ACP S-malonyltransferase [Spirochaetota bacterium]HPC42944.1 ACP S-malonyltransferase [Spirochaetota bacterium]HPL19087.1 ACP S-malonyltransferase [Spirochaetota bacterium]HQF07641.1 ACP S-malonyltransferase [Spirochaetota bacterium]HQH96372.1 ACP S-malonyltransferase [Spirochaetota bacterium]
MERKKTAVIFPAFGCKYLGNERGLLEGMSGDLSELAARAASAVGLNAERTLSCRDGNFEDELESQYAVYMYSCAVSNVLKRSGLHGDFTAGYSMGLYAALCHAECITFEQGLSLITTAYRGIRDVAASLPFGIGVISGLTREEAIALIDGNSEIEIINVNNRHNLHIAGYEKNVKHVLSRAKEQGAINCKYLTFHSPYHSRFMDGAAEKFREYCGTLTIYDPVYPVISTVDRRIMTSWRDVARDLVDNINRNINWLETMSVMIDAGVDVFVECGPGRSLQRMAKFIDGDFDVYNLQNLRLLLSSDRVCSSARAMNY